MNKELLKLKKIISSLENDKEHLQSKRLNAIMNLVRNNEITFEEFLKEFKQVIEIIEAE
jgi:exonuclease VII small subunit